MVKSHQIVITGASGFVARNLRKYLSEKNIKLISAENRLQNFFNKKINFISPSRKFSKNKNKQTINLNEDCNK